MIMKDKIIEFSSSLRASGLPVSIRSTKTAYKTACLFDNDIKALREALACVYVKELEQREKFDLIFDIIFQNKMKCKEKQESGKPDISNINSKDMKGKLHNKSQESRNESRRVNNAVIGLSKEIQNMYITKKSEGSGRSNRKKQNYKISKKFGSELDFDISLLNNKTRRKAVRKLIDSGYKTEDVFKVINQHDIKSNFEKMSFTDLLTLNNMTLSQLYPKIMYLCQKLGKKIATKRSRRLKSSSKGKINIRKTIRKNIEHGGTFLDRVNEKPKISKMNHYFLSDISASCDWISHWFFCIIYSSQKSFNKARVFEYDNKIIEITSALDESSIEMASDKVFEVREKNQMINRCSNMFSSFKSFLEQTNINKKSYIIILSDCRDWMGPKIHKTPKSMELIGNMVEKSKKVLILNPEPKVHWDKMDSCVSYYEEAGAEVFSVQNFEQLSNLIGKL